jgi:transposase-like protein
LKCPVTLKTDTHGRVRSTPERRAAILAEFEHSGVSAAQFAKLAGINYSTFAQWVQRHRRPKAGATARKPPHAARKAAGGCRNQGLDNSVKRFVKKSSAR